MVFDPAGEILWQGYDEEKRAALRSAGMASVPSLTALLDPGVLSGCDRGEILDVAERLGFISRRGAPKGMLTALPQATLLDQCMDAFNSAHLEALHANRIDFPLIFDRSEHDLMELTQSYEDQDRMFRLAGKDADLRLVYAADPSLFAWLRRTRLDARKLPYTIYTPLPVFRRWLSGEISLERMRQYPVPDVHVLCEPASAMMTFADVVKHASVNARFWVAEDLALSLEIVDQAAGDPYALARQFARAAGCYTVLKVLPSRPRYYSVKGGLMIYAGYGLLMLYNFQLDDTNGRRFQICLDDARAVTIIHATIAGGWPKMLPLMLGRGLTGVGPRFIPPELAMHQVICLPVADRHSPLAQATADRLAGAGVRAVAEAASGSLGARLHRLRQRWQPLRAVIGDREDGDEAVIESADGKLALPLAKFIADCRDRFERCRPLSRFQPNDPPFI